MSYETLRDIVRATCGGQSQRIKDYVYESMVMIYESSKEKERKEDED